MWRTVLTGLVALLAALAVPEPAAAAPAPPFAGDPLSLLSGPRVCAAGSTTRAHHRAQRLAMHCLINHARRRAARSRLRSSVPLRHAATYKARRIAACKTFTHSPCGDRLAVPFREARLTRQGAWHVGENLGWRPFRRATAREIVRGWLVSRPHREVLLDPRFREVGVRRRRLALRDAPRGAVLWVAHLGTPVADGGEPPAAATAGDPAAGAP